MNQDKYVFAQLTAFMNRTQFNNCVRMYDGNHDVKHFTCWNQLLAMMFGHLSNRESLRDLIVAFEAHRAKKYHLGVGREPIAKTTLASANQNCDCRIFEDFAFNMRTLQNPWSTKMMSWSIPSCPMASTSTRRWASTTPTGQSPSGKEVSSTFILWLSLKAMTFKALSSVAQRKAKLNVPIDTSRPSETTATSTTLPRTTSHCMIL